MKLKLFIDKNTNKVLYAEAGKHFVDYLLHTLMKPLGLAMKQNFAGAITGGLVNLYTSVRNDLDADYLQSGSLTKAAFDNPNISLTSSLRMKCRSCPNAIPLSVIGSSRCRKCCGQEDCYHSSIIPIGDGYVKGQVTYMVTDDLVVNPLSTSATIKFLSEIGIKDFACVQESQVSLDSDKLMKLVKASLTSNTVLTDILLPLDEAK